MKEICIFAAVSFSLLYLLHYLDYLDRIAYPRWTITVPTSQIKIQDGDTICLPQNVLKRCVRLEGIDAPEINQQCLNYNNQTINCGVVSMQKLKQMIKTHETIDVVYTQRKDKYKRFVGELKQYVGDEYVSLNEKMIEEGWAVAQYPSRFYKHLQEQAKIDQIGHWSLMDFQRPINYKIQTRRKKQKRRSKKSKEL